MSTVARQTHFDPGRAQCKGCATIFWFTCGLKHAGQDWVPGPECTWKGWDRLEQRRARTKNPPHQVRQSRTSTALHTFVTMADHDNMLAGASDVSSSSHDRYTTTPEEENPPPPGQPQPTGAPVRRGVVGELHLHAMSNHVGTNSYYDAKRIGHFIACPRDLPMDSQAGEQMLVNRTLP